MQALVWMAGNQAVEPSFDAFPGELEGHWIGSRVAAMQPSFLIQDVGVPRSNLTQCATLPPCHPTTIYFKQCCCFCNSVPSQWITFISSNHLLEISNSLKKCCLKGRMVTREETEIFCVLVHYSDTGSKQGWAMLKPGAGSLNFETGTQVPLISSGALAGSWMENGVAGTLVQDMGITCGSMFLSAPPYSFYPKVPFPLENLGESLYEAVPYSLPL